MQTQPRSQPSRAVEARRARQAAMTSDDMFKGGDPAMRRGGTTLRSPWHFASGHLWESAGKRGGTGQA